MNTEHIEIPGSHGSKLSSRLDLPGGPIRAYALIAHCFTCGKDSLASSRIARALTGHGIAVMRFDFTGIGSSDGDFASTNFSSNVADLRAVAQFMRDQDHAPTLLIGHSLGGAAVLSVAKHIPEVRAVITIAAPSDPGHVVGLFGDNVARIQEEGAVDVRLAGRPFRITRQFLEDVGNQRLLDDVANLDRPLLVLHSPQDTTVGVENGLQIFAAARQAKSFMALDGADHLLIDKSAAAYAADLLLAWSRRYLPREAEPAAPEVVVPDGTVLVAENHLGRYQQSIRVAGHQLVADEPAAVGGTGVGPGPYDFLLAALGACTSMTLRMYAERKELPLEHVSVALRHAKIHAQDCATCDTKEGRVDRIERQISLRGPLTPEQRTALLGIADRCPVHRTLQSEVSIVTSADTSDEALDNPSGA